jgi:hypothetical protein
MEYRVQYFNDIPEDDCVEVKKLEEFVKDFEIIICRFGSAYSKESIKQVEDSHRGVILRLTNGNLIYGYDIRSKLIKAI